MMALTSAEQEHPRLHALDAIRAAALLLGICLHACLSFVPGIDPNLWPVSDIHKSAALSVTVFVIHIFRMSVFFLMAGLLTRALFQRRGLSAFCRNRAARILAPLALGWLVCFALIVAIILWALARANNGQVPRSLPPAMLEAGPNFMHLWFLYLLLWLYAIAVAGRSALLAVDRNRTIVAWMDHALRVAVSSRTGPLALAVPIVVALFLMTDWVWSMGIPTPGYTLVPPPVPLFIYAYVFVIGWMLDRQRHLLNELGDRWPVNFLLGLVGTLVCLHLAGTEASGVIRGQPDKLLYAAAYGVALTCWTLAFVGAGARYLSRQSSIVRYVSDASYWMYIAHLPLVMALQTALMLADLHWAIKFLLINALSCVVLLITYHYWVRSTWIGLMLNGRRQSRGASRVGLSHDVP
jgi:glucan biosynthesis protein C